MIDTPPQFPAFLEFVRGQVTESAANTFTETELAVPTSRTEELAMLIWYVEFNMDRPSLEDAQSNNMQGQLTQATKSAIVALENADLLAVTRLFTDAGVVQGSLSEYLEYRGDHDKRYHFDPPILYAKQSVFLGVKGLGNSGAKALSVRVGYTLEKVSREQFIEALVD